VGYKKRDNDKLGKKTYSCFGPKRKKPVGENALCNGISDAAKRFCKSTHSTQRAESFTLTFLSTPAHKAPNGFGWYEFFPTPKLSTIPPSAPRAPTHETIQYNLLGAHYVLANHNPKPLQLRCKEGINAENVCTWQCARWNGHQWETNECQTLSTQPSHLTCFCSLASGFYR
jgi:hypothetical protein